MKKLLTLALAGALLFGTSCTKDEKDNGSETPSTLTGCNYHPYVVGTQITQRLNDEVVTTTYTKEEEFDGITWLYSESDKSKGYTRCGSEYFWIYDRAFTASSNGELKMRGIKLNGVVDDTWTDSFTLNGFPSHYTRTIVEIDGTRTVEGTEYTDVATVDIILYVDYGFGDGPVPATAYTEYYSKAFGFIESSLGATLISITL